jgi:hypothetical protein
MYLSYFRTSVLQMDQASRVVEGLWGNHPVGGNSLGHGEISSVSQQGQGKEVKLSYVCAPIRTGPHDLEEGTSILYVGQHHF